MQSERLCRFLRLTVERALGGRAAQIKEYTLGREVFDRDAQFDPRVDSIVRVEAARLRRKLREYYQTAGWDDPVVIGFPKGGYIPEFRYAAPPGQSSTSPSMPAAVEPQPLNSHTVAVLPFVNLSADPAQEYFCEGITEEILNTLARVPQLKVLARTSVFHFKGKGLDVRDIGRQLGAGTVIEGSVRTAGKHVRVAAKAIDAETGVLRWSGSFDRELDEVFAVQDEIARAIADSLRVSLAPSTQSALLSRRNMEAYTAYLKGCHFWNQVSEGGVQAALNQFTRALALFPDHAPSHASLANAYAHLTFWSVIPPSEGLPIARREAEEALRLDDGLSGAYAVLGMIVSCCEWQWEEGGRLLRRAIELQPSNMTAQTYYALHQLCRGQFVDVAETLERSWKLDPFSPWSFRNQGWYHYFQEQYDQAIEVLNTALKLDPKFREAQYMLASSYLRKGEYSRAIAEFEALPAGGFSAARWASLGEAQALAGDTAAARETLEVLKKLASTEYVSPINRLTVYAGLGDWDHMFAEMEQAYRDHCPWMCLIKVDPRYKRIRSDPRFVDILKRVHLS